MTEISKPNADLDALNARAEAGARRQGKRSDETMVQWVQRRVRIDPTDEDDTRLPCDDCGVGWGKHLNLDHPWKVVAYIDEHTTITTIGPSNSSEYVR